MLNSYHPTIAWSCRWGELSREVLQGRKDWQKTSWETIILTKAFSFKCFKWYICVCMHSFIDVRMFASACAYVQAWHHVHVKVRDKLKQLVLSFRHVTRVSNSGHQVRQHLPWLAQPSCPPAFTFVVSKEFLLLNSCVHFNQTNILPFNLSYGNDWNDFFNSTIFSIENKFSYLMPNSRRPISPMWLRTVF